MKNATMAIYVIALVIVLSASAISASDWGCECILCMSNPGGATQYKECRPPISKLERHLSKGGSFPSCEGAESNGYGIKQGYERYYSCQEAYGEGYQLTKIDTSEEGYFANQFFHPNKVCRKFMGYKTIRQWDDNDYIEKKVPVYSDRPVKWRSKPFYVELKTPNGEKRGRVWYKKKRKKRGFF